MEIDFLRHFGFLPNHLAALREAYGEHLLPLQEKVIGEGKLFERESLLICSPTSSGKTFLAEVLYLYHALNGRNTILLVPTKALANQRYEQLKARYSGMGYDILLSTRDHPFDDLRITEGRFHLAIVIYEKMRALMAMNDAFVSSLGACIVDEIHYLYHPGRGPDLELILTELLENTNLQILGLSAIVSSQQVTEWLKARSIVECHRPVELRQGVWCQGTFSYQEFNSKKEGTERFSEFITDIEGEAMLDAACQFATMQETTLLFWPQRDHCYTAARKLTNRFKPETALETDILDSLEPTAIRDFLAEILPHRVAVHTSDLTTQERKLVENLAQAGEIMLICATSTLAEGINFPVVNVLTTRRMYASSPEDKQTGRPPCQRPISQDQLCNMIGRAGRLGYKSYGRGIIVTTSPGDVDGLLSMYIKPELQESLPVLNQIPLNQILLRSIGHRESFTRESCVEFLLNTLSGRMRLLPDHLPAHTDSSFQQLITDGYITDEMGTYYLSPLGKLVVRNGLSVQSALHLDRFVESYCSVQPNPIEILVQICLLSELKDFFIRVSRSEILSHSWSKAISTIAHEQGLPSTSLILERLATPQKLRKDHHKAFKKTLLLYDWIQGKSIQALEKQYGIYSGAIQRLGEESSWLIGCLIELAAAHAFEKNWIDRLTALQNQVLFGLPEKALDWSPLLRGKKVSRDQVLSLIEAGFHSPKQIQENDRECLSDIIPEHVLDTIVEAKEKTDSAQSSSARLTIETDKGRQDRISINGQAITLTNMQSRLIHCLIKHPGKTVDYETILQEVWIDGIGDRKKIFRRKKEILKKVHNALGTKNTALIETIPGIGLILNATIQRGR